jgi:hypothetical protein
MIDADHEVTLALPRRDDVDQGLHQHDRRRPPLGEASRRATSVTALLLARIWSPPLPKRKNRYNTPSNDVQLPQSKSGRRSDHRELEETILLTGPQ